MGKSKKNIEDLKKKQKDLKPLQKKDMNKIIGGKKNKKWNNSCGGILPQ